MEVISYDDVIECENCGLENVVKVISEYDPETGATYDDIIAGQICDICGYELKF